MSTRQPGVTIISGSSSPISTISSASTMKEIWLKILIRFSTISSLKEFNSSLMFISSPFSWLVSLSVERFSIFASIDSNNS